ncbi:MAG: hypothetical protein KatS3mg112_0273 [Thermogutta sp.]|nr:MAG: hypothetical protein KatS3mg112_0273 [Thermogutta sp.]
MLPDTELNDILELEVACSSEDRAMVPGEPCPPFARESSPLPRPNPPKNPINATNTNQMMAARSAWLRLVIKLFPEVAKSLSRSAVITTQKAPMSGTTSGLTSQLHNATIPRTNAMTDVTLLLF